MAQTRWRISNLTTGALAANNLPTQEAAQALVKLLALDYPGDAFEIECYSA